MLIVTVTLIPVFDNKTGVESIQSFFEGVEGTIPESVGDDPIDNQSAAYDYWYAPENSFGIESTKSVNWTFFKQLFLAHTDWMLEARVGTGDWFNADQYFHGVYHSDAS